MPIRLLSRNIWCSHADFNKLKILVKSLDYDGSFVYYVYSWDFHYSWDDDYFINYIFIWYKIIFNHKIRSYLFIRSDHVYSLDRIMFIH